MLLYVLILALLQGITEFFPVSSSGHLAVGSRLFQGFDQPGIIFEILLHCATSIAVIIYLRKEIWGMIKGLFPVSSTAGNNRSADIKNEGSKYRRLLVMVIAASIPTAIIGFLLKDTAEKAFSTNWMVAGGFIITACILFAGKFFTADKYSIFNISLGRALLIGIFQGIAVFPGISRSGMTITAGLFAGFKPEDSAKFSFLLSLPAILGALILDLKELNSIDSANLLYYLIGMIIATAIGYISIKFLVSIIKKWKLYYFAPYCLLLGIILLLLK